MKKLALLAIFAALLAGCAAKPMLFRSYATPPLPEIEFYRARDFCVAECGTGGGWFAMGSPGVVGAVAIISAIQEHQAKHAYVDCMRQRGWGCSENCPE